MSTTLDNRAELRLAFYRLTGFSDGDGSLSEHEVQSGDTVNSWLQEGLWEAQSWYLSNADPHLWKRTIPLAVEEDDEGKFVRLPGDFLRLYGDQENSAIRKPGSSRWGRLIPPEDGQRRAYASYWIENRDRLRFSRGTSVETGLVLDYNYRHPVLSSDDEGDDEEGAYGVIDFPVEDRRLIVALAAEIASQHPSFPAGFERAMQIQRYADQLKTRIYTRARRTREPRKVRHPRGLGSHWLSTGR